MKGIMYHYVKEDDKEFPNFKHLHVEDFKKQLNYFEDEFGFVTKEDFLDSFKTGIIPKGIILTFDDGLSDHYKYVYPLLKEKKIWGIFYIPTSIFDNKILDVHKIHLLLGKYESKLMYSRLKELVTEEMLTDINITEFNSNTYTKQINDDYSLAFKRTLNYTIGYRYRGQIIDHLMNEFFSEQEGKLRNFYIKAGELAEMQNNGMIIGSHTINHLVMSKLSIEEQKIEIEDSFSKLSEEIGNPEIKTFCYPYGGFHSFTPETESLLNNNNCLFSFNVEPRDIDVSDVLYRQQALPRYDCNAFKFGQCR